jgi:hypothetical protein
MSIRIELRYAVLTSLCVLLWLVLEYAVGLQDTYIAMHPFVSIAFSIIIPFVTYRMALREKIEEKFGKLSFRRAFVSGLLITVLSTILLVPVLLGFHKLINPDLLQNLIVYTTQSSKYSLEQAAVFFNLKAYITGSVVEAFVVGVFVSLILAFRMRTVK